MDIADTARTSARTVLELRAVTVHFEDRPVLDALTAAFGPGARVAVEGPNGAGKTTLLRCVAGTLIPRGGEVRVEGAPAHTLGARARVGAVLGPERAFALRLSGRENLRLAARLRIPRVAAAEQAVERVVEELELADFADRRASACSTGMLQQIAFARALLGEPQLVVLDEPTRSMDATARERLWRALDDRPHATVLIASHDEHDAERCGERLALGGR